MTAKYILINYYSSMHLASSEGMYKEAREVLAFAPKEFFEDLADKLKTNISNIVEIFKNWKVVQFFAKIGWSFKKLWQILRSGWQYVRELSEAFKVYLEENKVLKVTSDAIKKFDNWLEERDHKKWSGIIVAAVLMFVYFFMADTGNPLYDYDFSNILDALKGNFNLSDLFSGYEGIKLFTLFSIGFFAKITFPWPGPNETRFFMAMMVAITKEIKSKQSFAVIDSILKEAKWIKNLNQRRWYESFI